MNLEGTLFVIVSLEMAHAILLEAALSFLGFRAQPSTASWGLMLADARDFVLFSPWLVAIPGVALTILVLAMNLIGDGLRDFTQDVTMARS
jgi:peptide/nickel transport system permease protein